MSAPNLSFNEANFRRDLYASKPPGYIPVNYIRNNVIVPEEVVKMRLPDEAIRLVSFLKNESYSHLQEKVRALSLHFCNGILIHPLNRWRWICIQTGLLSNESIRLMTSKTQQDTCELAVEIFDQLFNGVADIEVHLRAPETDIRKCFDEGKRQIVEANNRLQKIRIMPNLSAIKERVQLLTDCLEDRKELFPLLLLPTNYVEDKYLDDYGIQYVETLQKMCVQYPQSARQEIEKLEDLLKKIKKELIPDLELC